MGDDCGESHGLRDLAVRGDTRSSMQHLATRMSTKVPNRSAQASEGEGRVIQCGYRVGAAFTRSRVPGTREL